MGSDLDKLQSYFTTDLNGIIDDVASTCTGRIYNLARLANAVRMKICSSKLC